MCVIFIVGAIKLFKVKIAPAEMKHYFDIIKNSHVCLLSALENVSHDDD